MTMQRSVESVREDAVISLREIDKETGYAVLRLKVADHQAQFVAPNAYSLAEAYLEPNAWPRAIYADETPVGFLMLLDEPEQQSYYLWRYMIDARYQGRGFGRQALALLIEHVKTRPGATHLRLSYVPDIEGNPEPFYRKLGFQPTGEIDGGEVVMALALG